MLNINYLSLDEIIAIHFDQIEKYGGSHGIRDLDLLLSALARPKASFGGFELYPNIFKKVASLIHSLILNHPFVDGNKRTGVVSAARFLYTNEYKLTSTKQDLLNLALKIANKKLDIGEISVWFKKHSKSLSS